MNPELVEKAKAVNDEAVRDVHEELEEDATSEHNVGQLSQTSGDSSNKS